jgi:competence protein ComEC
MPVSNGEIGESGELASLILKLTYKDFDLLLTGDAQVDVLSRVALKNQKSIEVLQVLRHCLGTRLNKAIVERIAPRLAVISVAVANRYGHPHKDILEMLKEVGIPTLRTDQKRDIEVVSNGKGFG